MVTLIERHLHGLLLRVPRLATTRRGNFVSGRDGLIYIKGAIALTARAVTESGRQTVASSRVC